MIHIPMIQQSNFKFSGYYIGESGGDIAALDKKFYCTAQMPGKLFLQGKRVNKTQMQSLWGGLAMPLCLPSEAQGNPSCCQSYSAPLPSREAPSMRLNRPPPGSKVSYLREPPTFRSPEKQSGVVVITLNPGTLEVKAGDLSNLQSPPYSGE